MIENPVFIVGTERSGSNLLRVLLNELPSICIPHPPHLMRDLTPLVPRYGDLTNAQNFRRLIHHAVRLVDLHFAPWPLKLDEERIVREAPRRDLYSVYACIYEQFREHMGKARWACKSTFMVHHVEEILGHHRQPQFIHLVRDPRDVATSARKSIFSHYHPYFVAELWRREQSAGLAAARRLPASTWLTLRYEDLIREPKKEMRRVCKFLGESYSDKLLRYFEGSAARQLSDLSRSWENVGRPILKDNSEKYKSELKPGEIALVEGVAGEVMSEFGYDCVAAAAEARKKLSYELVEKWLTLKSEGMALIQDKNARIRLKKKAYLRSLRYLA